MRRIKTSSEPARIGLHFILLATLLVVLWVAGGASRPEVIGQFLVRSAAWVCLIVAVLFASPPSFSAIRPALFIILAALAVALVQLIPLPPAVWAVLPGRAVFTEAARLSGEPQPWRPLAIVPTGAINAAMSLIVPLATVYLLGGLRRHEHYLLGQVLLGMAVASMIAGLIQFSGGGFNNPLLNGIGEVSGNFANHNHFALFIALGCLLAVFWMLQNGHLEKWRASLGFGLILVFTLTVLASGSRAGTILAAIALLIALGLLWRPLRGAFERYPRWVFPAIVIGLVIVFALVIAFTIASDRALSVQRAATVAIDNDMRSRGLPVVLTILGTYFPAGAGLGSFDPIFRLHEPFALLKPTYFNHAHNDFLEIIIDTGIAGVILLVAGLAWWTWASWTAWRRRRKESLPAKIGSAMILLVLLASAVDYPARTPIIMAILCIAATWLHGFHKADKHTGPALPVSSKSI